MNDTITATENTEDNRKEDTVTLRGNLGADPQIINTRHGQPMARFSLAVGNQDEETKWFSVTCFNPKLAQAIAENANKGSRITITGRLETKLVVVEGELREYSDVLMGDDSTVIL